MNKLKISEISSAFKTEYQSEFIKQLNTEPVLSRLVREEKERKEKIIRESLEPWRLWLVDHIKWRRAKRWLVREFRVVENANGNKRIMRVYKGGLLLNYEEFPIGPEMRFVRHRFQGGD